MRHTFTALQAAALLLASAVMAAERPFPPADTVQGWANRYYPALVSAQYLLNGVHFGFLVDQHLSVVEHSVVIPTAEEGVNPSELRAMFPRRNFDPATVQAMCFDAVAGRSPRQCVIWAKVKR